MNIALQLSEAVWKDFGMTVTKHKRLKRWFDLLNPTSKASLKSR